MAADGIVILRLVLAAVLGGLVGLEREVNGREAGVRTYLLVSLGSALIMILSQYLAFGLTGNGGAVRVDPGRIAAQAVTGIGFLGAGVIIRYGNSIRGLTTAACMWVTCAVGLSIGAGYYLYGTRSLCDNPRVAGRSEGREQKTLYRLVPGPCRRPGRSGGTVRAGAEGGRGERRKDFELLSEKRPVEPGAATHISHPFPRYGIARSQRRQQRV